MKVGVAGLQLCASFEKFSPRPYWLGDGRWTIGYGETQGVTRTTGPWTQAYAWARFVKRMNEDYGAAVDRFLRKHGIKVNQNQFDALVSLAYNLGTGIFIDGAPTGQTMRDALKRGKVTEATFTAYRMPGSKFEQGLLRRRKAEYALWRKPSNPYAEKLRKWRAELTHRRAQLRGKLTAGQHSYVLRRKGELESAIRKHR